MITDLWKKKYEDVAVGTDYGGGKNRRQWDQIMEKEVREDSETRILRR